MRLRWPLVIITTAALSIAACAGAAPDEPPASTIVPTIAPTPTQQAIAPGGEPGAAVEIAIQACREKDAGLLRQIVATPLTDEEVQELFDRGTLVRLVSQTVPDTESGNASITVRLEVSHDGLIETVERSWSLVHGEDDVWRFTELPDCI